jgi:hypothetical protein
MAATHLTESSVFEKAMTTGRSAKKLARKHGFGSVDHLAETLPQNARVVDVGAGASRLGHEVTIIRPDVDWINFDLSYHDPAILSDVARDAPRNLHHVPGDALDLGQMYPPAHFDAVFSYWLFPHLSLVSRRPAELAAMAIFAVTKPRGLISIGPVMSTSRLPSMKYQRAFSTAKSEDLDGHRFADLVVDRTRVFGYTRYVEILSNEVMTTFFGTSRYFKQVGLMRQHVYDPKSRTYINPLSRSGMRIAMGLGFATARYVTRRNTRPRTEYQRDAGPAA